MHGYVYAMCKTKDCPGKLYIAHLEFPETTAPMMFFDYPDHLFPVAVPCGSCGQTHQYSVKELGTETSPIATHPPQWQPVLRNPPPTRRDTN